MRITILAPGSRGDVQPLVALGRALIDRGHHVRLAADPAFAALAIGNGLDFASSALNTQAMLRETQEELGRRGDNPIVLLRAILRHSVERAPEWGRASLAQCRDADVIIAGGGAVYPAFCLADHLKTKLVSVMLQPMFPTSAFCSPIMPPARVPCPFNRLSHLFVLTAAYWGFRPMTNVIRCQVLGQRPWPLLPVPRELRRADYPILCAVSPTLVPPPADLPPRITVTGAWFLDDRSNWQPNTALAQFIAAGPKPVYLGFGSMVDPAAGQTAAMLVQALREAGQRVLLATGWSGLDDQGAGDQGSATDLHIIREAPHDRLLPLVASAIHHGGAGTTSAALRAGIPQLVIPVLGDQPFWAGRAMQLGVSAGTLMRRHLSPTRLAPLIRRLVSDTELQHQAASMADLVRWEDGLARAVATIEAAGGYENTGRFPSTLLQ